MKIKSNKFFEDLKKGMQEILNFKKGKIQLSTEFTELVKPSAEYKVKEIKTIAKNSMDFT